MHTSLNLWIMNVLTTLPKTDVTSTILWRDFVHATSGSMNIGPTACFLIC